MATASIRDSQTPSLGTEPRPEREPSEAARELAMYAASALLCLLLAGWAFSLHARDLRSPLIYSGDSLVVLSWTKSLMENPWYLHNDSQGMPDGCDLHDFPTSDSFQFLLMKLIGLAVGDPFLVVNLYFLLTFFLVALCAALAFRQAGIDRPVAVVLALLYAFLPCHFGRGTPHLFLSGYYLVPLMAMVLLRLYCGERSLWEHDGQQEKAVIRLWQWRTARLTLFCLVFASAGVYYAAFAVLFLGAVGLGASIARRSAVPLCAAAMLAGVLAAGFLANMAPSLAYRWQHGANPKAVVRSAPEAEVFGLKVAQLVLPVAGHRIRSLARKRGTYDAGTPLVNENGAATLGFVGSAGFLLLLGHALFGRRRLAASWLDGAAMLTLAGVLFATVGGFASLVSIFVSPLIRSPNRISVFLAFFALLAVGLALGRVARHVRSVPAQAAWYGFLALLLAGGVLDQVSPSYHLPVAPWPAFQSDRAFVRRVEAAAPAGAMVFQLPYVAYVGHEPPHAMEPYGHLAGYLHSRRLRWSYGAIEGRGTDAWQKSTAGLPTGQMLEEVKAKGFSGVWVDRRGYADRAARLEADLGARLGSEPLVSDDGHLAYFALGG